MPTITTEQQPTLDINDVFEDAMQDNTQYKHTFYDKLAKALAYLFIGIFFGGLFVIGIIISINLHK